MNGHSVSGDNKITFQFLVAQHINSSNSRNDTGWLILTWGYYPCLYKARGEKSLQILYAKGNKIAKFDTNGLGFADRLDVFVTLEKLQ